MTPQNVTRAHLAQIARARRWAAIRMWLYGVAIAAVPVAVYFGWIEPEASPIVLPLILAVLNVKRPQLPTPDEGENDDQVA